DYYCAIWHSSAWVF
nr:immunoglobulin light chain junction region [Macaca mulatta]MOW06370.1 immunoglobulin light chain junction region [Macaca mulatta]MOW27281.1 immunoglobulin light chain junction region [Macaca mulatta]MOW27284.1 immunoglobulin light chain junction region [Macaca mulatta]MOW27351.1 immunoglobulin light chain junction region [Macaca mulatta]